MNKIDNLFRNKLDSHEVIPTVEAWRKINSQLNQNKRKKGAIWMSIAAAVTLIIVSITYFNNEVPNDNNKLQISEILPEKEVVIEESVNQIEESNTQEESINSNKIIQIAPETVVAQNEKPTIPAININTEEKEVIPIAVASNNESTINDEQIVNKVTIDLTEENKTNIAEIENVSKKETVPYSSVKITYNLQPVVKIDSSVFTEKEIGIDSKSGVLGKIVAFAKNAKASDVSLGQLRAAKDDLLSFDNFKSNKQTQNK